MRLPSLAFSRAHTRTAKLSLTFLALSFLLLSSALVLIVVSQIWRMQWSKGVGSHTLRSFVLSGTDLTAATALGVALLSVLIIGALGFAQGYRPGSLQRKEAKGLILFCWTLVGTMIATLGVASVMWFFTLTEIDDFRKIWLEKDDATQAFLQDKLACCGYFNATSAGLFNPSTATSGICAPFTQPGSNLTSVQGCTTPIVQFADFFLNNVFTTIYGFTTIQFALFLTTCCLIISRRDDERFRLVREKAGGGAFV
ncbi:hypothetical protein JCM6882_001649 [Rhodosporidiobolus microsporus]